LRLHASDLLNGIVAIGLTLAMATRDGADVVAWWRSDRGANGTQVPATHATGAPPVDASLQRNETDEPKSGVTAPPVVKTEPVKPPSRTGSSAQDDRQIDVTVPPVVRQRPRDLVSDTGKETEAGAKAKR